MSRRVAKKSSRSARPRKAKRTSTDALESLREALRLSEVLDRLNAAESTDTLLERLLEAAVRTIGTEEGSISQLDPRKAELSFRAAYSYSEEQLKELRIPISSGVLGYVARSGQSICIQDVSEDPHFDKRVDEVLGFTTHSLMATPILRGDEVIGVLELVNLLGDEDVTQEDVSVLDVFADAIAIVLMQEKQRKGPVAFVERAIRSRKLPASGEPSAVAREVLRGLSQYRQDPSYRRSLRLASMVRTISQRGEEETRFVERLLSELVKHRRNGSE
ncbi:MAG: GAF domain-containing protein [Myxococcota bacterium]|nr:GAF domain-containing protein [Myxococcota bacterium]